MTNTARAVAAQALAAAQAAFLAAEAAYNETLPELPATLRAVGLDESECPADYNGRRCGAGLTAWHREEARSPVLGWTDEAPFIEGPALLVGDYYWGDSGGDPIHRIGCYRGHEFRVPTNIDRDV